MTQTNVYNAKGERIRKGVSTIVNGSPREEETLFFYDESGHLIAEDNQTNFDMGGGWGSSVPKPTVSYAWLEDRLVAMLPIPDMQVIGQPSPVLYIETDHLGTPRAIFDPVQQEPMWIWELSDGAFGDSLPDEDPDGNGSTFEAEVGVPFNLRYPGQYYDSASGLHYNYFRDYEPGIGRYVESDPIGLRGGPSTYGYVLGNPMTSVDPLGLANTVVCTDGGGMRVSIGSDSSGGVCGLSECLAAHESCHAEDMMRNSDAIAFCKIPANSGLPASVSPTEAGRRWKQQTELKCTKVEQDCLEEQKRAQSRHCKSPIQTRINLIEELRCDCEEDENQCNFN